MSDSKLKTIGEMIQLAEDKVIKHLIKKGRDTKTFDVVCEYIDTTRIPLLDSPDRVILVCTETDYEDESIRYYSFRGNRVTGEMLEFKRLDE